MGEFRTGFGEVFSLERRLPALGWKPRRRGVGNLGDAIDIPDFGGGDDFGILAIIATVIFVVIAALVLVPLLLFMAEVAVVVALVIPITIVALVLGGKRHTVSLRRVSDGLTVDSRQVRGVYGSIKGGRELRAAAERGAYPVRSVGAPTASGMTTPYDRPPGRPARG